MTADNWLEANGEYLRASVTWLQLRLRHLLSDEPPPSSFERFDWMTLASIVTDQPPKVCSA